MNLSTRILTSTLAVATLAAPAAALAKGPHGSERNAQARVERLLDHIGADASTREAVEALAEERRPEADRLAGEASEARRALRALLDAGEVSRDEALAQAQEVGRLETASRVYKLDTMLQIRELLTPEQRATLESLRNARTAELEEACGDDLAALCPEADDDPRSTMRCLMRNRGELSDACASALPELRHGGWAHGGGGGTCGHGPGKGFGSARGPQGACDGTGPCGGAPDAEPDAN